MVLITFWFRPDEMRSVSESGSQKFNSEEQGHEKVDDL